jgi:type I restriction enzyme S subunit
MLEGLKPYDAYRPSGTDRLGPFPAHWPVHRAKVFLREVDERSVSGTEELLSVSHKTGVTPRRERNVTMFLAESNVGHKMCRPGDVVVNTMWAWMAAVGTSEHTGLVSPSYGVYRPRSPGQFEHRFLDELLRTPKYRDEYVVRSTGITSSRLRLYPDQFLNIPLPVPPPDEQAAIVRFLDHADRRIRRYIRVKQKLIKLLEEQKQAIIHQAVTRGLDPSVPMKDSGIPWIGSVPQHWRISRVKGEFESLNASRIPLSSTERGKMTLRRYDYYGASGIIDKVEDFIFDDELLLIAEDGANLVLRNLPLAIVARGRFWVNNHAHILKPRRGNLNYLACMMESIDYSPWITGAAQPKLTKDRLMSVQLAVPPAIEQDAIMAAVGLKTTNLRSSLAVAKNEVDFLREFRTRLIADVVTGQLDVRAAAAALPDEPLNDADETGDDDLDADGDASPEDDAA